MTQLAINTAIVYMHRFYMHHNFSRFHRNSIAPSALFLAAKVEEQPRKLEHVIKVASNFLNHEHHQSLDIHSEAYAEKAQELVMNENILLQTLGFDVAIDHPHTYVVKCFQMVRALMNLPQTSYFMATNSLHMTTMCLQYKPSVVACVCIDIVCRWSNYEIQRYTEGKDWFVLVDPTVTTLLLEKLSSEFIAVLDKCPNLLKKYRSMNTHGVAASLEYRPPRHTNPLSMSARSVNRSNEANNSSKSQHPSSSQSQHPSSSQHVNSVQSKTVLSHKEYTEKRDKERRDRERQSAQVSSSHPVSSSSQRADQLRMPPPVAPVPMGRNQVSHRDVHQRKEHITNDKPERVGENHEITKGYDKISENHDKISENHDYLKGHDRTKHSPIKQKIEMKPNKHETNNIKIGISSISNNTNLSIKDSQPSIDNNLKTVVSAPLSSTTMPIIKKELASPNVSQNSKPKSNSTPFSLYHPRLDGKPKSGKEFVNVPQGLTAENSHSLTKAEKYTKEDVTTIPSISKLISQSMTKAPKEETQLEATTISSTSHMSRKYKNEHSHKHDKDKKRKKSKHKSKDKKEKHKESKDHKKSKKPKKHKDKDKEREKDSKQVKSIFDVEEDDESSTNTPIKLTINYGDKRVYTPDNSQVPTKNEVTNDSVSLAGGLKITIPKSRLPSNTLSQSPPRGIPPRDSYTPNVKLKIPKEKVKYDKESRKRERSPTGKQQPNKYLRTSGAINLQKVLDCGRWNNQGP